jgi:hypothetical protein
MPQTVYFWGFKIWEIRGNTEVSEPEKTHWKVWVLSRMVADDPYIVSITVVVIWHLPHVWPKKGISLRCRPDAFVNLQEDQRVFCYRFYDSHLFDCSCNTQHGVMFMGLSLSHKVSVTKQHLAYKNLVRVYNGLTEWLAGWLNNQLHYKSILLLLPTLRVSIFFLLALDFPRHMLRQYIKIRQQLLPFTSFPIHDLLITLLVHCYSMFTNFYQTTQHHTSKDSTLQIRYTFKGWYHLLSQSMRTSGEKK